MKKSAFFILPLVCCLVLLSGCSLFRNKGKGCPTDGRNIGAERLAAGDLNAKESKKARKARFRG
ncbi:hypothetical protein ACFS6H_01930 [Terrimonas rubra]|uniref:Lipoprotein n=1 Tax=Terrimonas rubra TaxID=1035890 RepID=A0ABW5ZZK2_9BACT